MPEADQQAMTFPTTPGEAVMVLCPYWRTHCDLLSRLGSTCPKCGHLVSDPAPLLTATLAPGEKQRLIREAVATLDQLAMSRLAVALRACDNVLEREQAAIAAALGAEI